MMIGLVTREFSMSPQVKVTTEVGGKPDVVLANNYFLAWSLNPSIGGAKAIPIGVFGYRWESGPSV